MHDWLDYLSVTSTVALAAIGYFGVRYAKRTLDNIERQANTMENQAADARAATVQSTGIAQKAADAALMQANYLVASERAWLAIAPVNKENAFLQPNTVPQFWWEIRNVGKTPAKLIDTSAMCGVHEDVPSLPETPAFSSPIELRERILAPGGSMRFFTYFSKGFTLPPLAPSQMPSLEDIVALIAFGYVKYRIVVGGKDQPICESGFCDHWFAGDAKEPIEFRPKLDAPAIYTKHT